MNAAHLSWLLPSRAPRSRASRGQGGWIRTLGAVAAFGLGFAPTGEAAADSPDNSPHGEKMTYHVGIVRRAFAGTNQNDAIAAYRYLNFELGKKFGYDLAAEIAPFDSLVDFARSIRTGAVSLILADSWDYLAMDLGDALEPKAVTITGGRAAHRWMLLVRRDGKFKSVVDLQGHNIAVFHTAASSLGEPWMETELLELGLGNLRSFFGRLDTVGKASAAILPVFFGKLSACIVDEAAFEVMAEMNPQISQSLTPLIQSEPLVGGAIFFNRTGWPSAKLSRDVAQSLIDLERQPAGRQILTLFKCDRLAAFEPAQLEPVRRLFDRHRKLLTAQNP